MLTKTISLARKITILIVLSIVGIFILHAAAPPVQVQSESMRSVGSTMQGGGAMPQAQTATSGLCAAIKNSGPKISLISIITTPDISKNISSILGAVGVSFTSGVCSFYSSTISFINNRDFMFGTSSDITYGQTLVVKLWNVLADFSKAILMVLWVIVGYNVMRGESVSVAIPRLVLASVLALGAYTLASNFIDLESGMCQMIIYATGSLPNNMSIAKSGIDLATLFLGNTGTLDLADFATNIPALFILFASIAVAFEMIIRIAAIDLLLVLSPVLCLYGLPQCQKWANLWVVAFVSMVMVQFLQVTAICLAGALIKNFGGPTTMSLLVGIAMLFLVLKIPGWFGGFVSSTLTGVGTPYDLAGQAANAAFGAVRAAIAAAA